MTDLTIDFAPDGPTATWLFSGSPTLTRGETVTLELGFGPDDVSEYEAMLDQLAFVEPVWTGRQRNGVPWVLEDLPNRAPVSTQVFEITPGADMQDLSPFWAVITGGSDDSEPPNGLRRVSVDVVVLADGAEYAGRSALKSDIGAVSL